ncbi:pancreatic lipase-related protein 2 [Haematobia irritans]|uniref:pancreatic lipase-related protein 2 n=1 Tax=Haematobia irritans TaxID=7368 RepID=UPI003F4FC8C5
MGSAASWVYKNLSFSLQQMAGCSLTDREHWLEDETFKSITTVQDSVKVERVFLTWSSIVTWITRSYARKMHFLHMCFQLKVVLLFLLIKLTLCSAFGHKITLMKNSFRYLQENMLRNSMNRAKINYDIIFECRSNSDTPRKGDTTFILQMGDLRGFHRLDPTKKLAFFLHGWNDEGSKEWVHDMLFSWTRYKPNYSVCVVDWGHLSQMDYKTASMSIFDVGLTVAAITEFLEGLWPNHITRRNVTIAGYSLGAHAAGYAGAALNGEIEQIIGLDPAGPLFTLPAVVSAEFRLDPTDARYVQVLHTSSGTLGANIKLGHADFYPNGGTAPQKNCNSFLQLTDFSNTNPIACSHSTAAVFFKQSMNPAYPFIGYHCDSYRSFSNGHCSGNRYGRFGVHSQRKKRGDFYFDTLSHKPYVLPPFQQEWSSVLGFTRKRAG